MLLIASINVACFVVILQFNHDVIYVARNNNILSFALMWLIKEVSTNFESCIRKSNDWKGDSYPQTLDCRSIALPIEQI